MSETRSGRPDTPGPRLRIGGFDVDAASGEVTGPDAVARLEPRVLEVLLVLAARPGEVVSKEDLLREVWPHTAVSDDVIWRCIAALRRAFGDDSRAPQVIETLSRRGYRLIASVDEVTEEGPMEPPGLGAAVRVPMRSPRARLAALCGAAVVLVAALTIGSMRDAAPADTALAAWPTDWDADELVRVGREYYERRTPGDVTRAEQLFKRALQHDDRHAGAYAGLADAYAQRVSRFGGAIELAVEAVAAAERAVALDPALPEAYKALGFAQTVAGRPVDAMDSYRRALELRPDYQAARMNLGSLLGGSGRYAEAVLHYTAIESHTLNRAIDLHNIGMALAQLGRAEAAREYFEAALGLDPLQPESVLALGRLEIIAGDIAAARSRLDAARGLDPHDRELLRGSATLAAVEGDLDRAREEYEEALAGVSQYRDIFDHARLAWVYRQLGQPEPLAELIDDYASRLPEAFASRGQWRLAELAAAVALLRGDRSGALGWLRRGLDAGHVDAAWLPFEPLFMELHDDPAFLDLLTQARARHAIESAAVSEALVANTAGPDR